MEIYNNFVINANSERYQPFLFNLFSGRRRLLNEQEFMAVKAMINGSELSEETISVRDMLFREKQFITDEDRDRIENSLLESGYWNSEQIYADDYRFSIELTRDCNMKCAFCYASAREKGYSMTKEHIDEIYRFYEKYADDHKKIEATPYIRITGGETLVSEASASLIGYVAEKWKNAEIDLFTNGINLLKYYEYLPINRLSEVNISLDGTEKIHLKHRFNGMVPDNISFGNIIDGIKKLLADGINVKIKTVLDADNYKYFGELKDFLLKEEILNSPNCEHIVSVALDYKDELGVMEGIKDLQEINKIRRTVESHGGAVSTYPSLSVLYSLFARNENAPCKLKCTRCNNKRLANLYFSSNGKVYHCDCMGDEISPLGTFFPKVKIDDVVISTLENRNIFKFDKCCNCKYKYVCLGGCPLNGRATGSIMECGAFKREDILDNLEYDYAGLLRRRKMENGYEAN